MTKGNGLWGGSLGGGQCAQRDPSIRENEPFLKATPSYWNPIPCFCHNPKQPSAIMIKSLALNHHTTPCG